MIRKKDGKHLAGNFLSNPKEEKKESFYVARGGQLETLYGGPSILREQTKDFTNTGERRR